PFHQNSAFNLEISKWQEINPQLRAGFTTRNGGVSHFPYTSWNFGFHVGDEKEHVIKNRELLAEKVSLAVENLVSGEQTHQTTIQIVDGRDKGKCAKTNQTVIAKPDGLITIQKDILCT